VWVKTGLTMISSTAYLSGISTLYRNHPPLQRPPVYKHHLFVALSWSTSKPNICIPKMPPLQRGLDHPSTETTFLQDYLSTETTPLWRPPLYRDHPSTKTTLYKDQPSKETSSPQRPPLLETAPLQRPPLCTDLFSTKTTSLQTPPIFKDHPS
jgi:hypothetical protein